MLKIRRFSSTDYVEIYFIGKSPTGSEVWGDKSGRIFLKSVQGFYSTMYSSGMGYNTDEYWKSI